MSSLMRTPPSPVKFLWAVLVIIAAQSWTQPPTLFAQRFHFEHYTVDDGLSQSQVHTIFRNKKGYVWFGTSGGLCRYNGVVFTPYNNTNGLPEADLVFCGFVDDKNDIWLGLLGGGIVQMVFKNEDKPSFNIFNTATGLPSNNIYSAKLMRDGSRIFGTESARFIIIKNGEIKTVQLDSSAVEDNCIRAIVEDSQGMIWFAVYKSGIIRYNPFNGQKRLIRSKLPDLSIPCMLEDSDHNIWAGSKAGLIKITSENNGELKIHTYDKTQGLPSNTIYAIDIDIDGNLWIGTKRGLSNFKNGIFNNYTTKNGLINNRILSVYIDENNIKWIGTAGGGDKLSQAYFKSYTIDHGLPANYISALFEDKNDTLWIGTIGGDIVKFANNKFITNAVLPEIGYNTIRAIFQDSRGQMWIGSSENLLRISAGSSKKFDATNGLKDTYIRSITEDADGNLWLSNRKGITSFDPKKENPQFIYINSLSGIQEPSVWYIFMQSSGAMWVASNGAGIFRLENGVWTNFQEKDGLSSNQVFSICEDKSGQLWFATKNGVTIYDGTNFRKMGIEQGLADKSIWCVRSGPDGSIWLGSNKGLNRLFDWKISHFTYQNGLANNEVNINCIYFDHLKRMWVGTVGGLTQLNFRGDHTIKSRPVTHIEKVTTEQYTGVPRSNMQFDHAGNNISFEFIGLWFIAESQVKYQFYLEGFEKHWGKVSPRRFAEYTNLPPGKYTFHVRSRNGEGVWGKEAQPFTFTIQKAYWQSWWFYVAIVTLLTALIRSGLKWRLKRIAGLNALLEMRIKDRTLELENEILVRKETAKKLRRAKDEADEANRAKSEFLANMSHELRTPMHAILSYSRFGIRKIDSAGREKLHDYFVNINLSATRLMTFLNDLLDLSKLEAGKMNYHFAIHDLYTIAATLEAELAALLREKALKLVIKRPETSILAEVDRTRITQVISNLLSNAIKFSYPDSRIVVEIKDTVLCEQDETVPAFEIRIIDEGIGLPDHEFDIIFEKFIQSQKTKTGAGGTGLGLSICKEIVLAHGGKIWAERNPSGQGSIFAFYIPKARGESISPTGLAVMHSSN